MKVQIQGEHSRYLSFNAALTRPLPATRVLSALFKKLDDPLPIRFQTIHSDSSRSNELGGVFTLLRSALPVRVKDMCPDCTFSNSKLCAYRLSLILFLETVSCIYARPLVRWFNAEKATWICSTYSAASKSLDMARDHKFLPSRVTKREPG